MLIRTYGDIRTEVEAELDLENEVNITPDRMVTFCNDAISEAESEIMKISEDYFLTYKDYTFVADKVLYDLPEDIYAMKIRSFMFNKPEKIYEIYPIVSMTPFADIASNDQINSETCPSRYILLNTIDGIKMRLTPPIREAGKYGVLWYIREAIKIPLVTAGTQADSDATNLDIPQYYLFIKAAMKKYCVLKEGHPMMEIILKDYAEQKKLMIEALKEKVPDNNTNRVVADFGHYADHS
jgi:hypothetical protein